MALTLDQQRQVSSRFQDQLSALPASPVNLKEPVSVTKHEITDAVAAMDGWFDANMASFKAALPEPVRTTFTPEQIARLAVWVVRARFNPEDHDAQ